MKRSPRAVPHEEGLYEDLRDPREAALYLNACIEDGNSDGILLALFDIAKANNLAKTAERIQIHRVSLYKMLTRHGNPSFRNILKVLDAIGIGIRFVPVHHGKMSKQDLAA